METKTNAKQEVKIGVTTKLSDLKKELPKNEILNANEKLKRSTGINHLSAETRIKNLENFQILAKRYQSLKDKEEELIKFSLANDGIRIKLALYAENVPAFKVSNTETLNTIMGILKKDLENRITTTEKEIQEFNI